MAIPPDPKNGADIHNKMGYWIDIVKKRYPNKHIDEDIQRPANIPNLIIYKINSLLLIDCKLQFIMKVADRGKIIWKKSLEEKSFDNSYLSITRPTKKVAIFEMTNE